MASVLIVDDDARIPALLLLWLQMFGTIAPIFLFPEEVFTRIPYGPTLEGQYIIKNLVLASAGIVVGATVRGDWTGVMPVTGLSATTDSAGLAVFQSPQTRQRGTFIFTVTGVSHTGYTYAPATNTETTDSIQR